MDCTKPLTFTDYDVYYFPIFSLVVVALLGSYKIRTVSPAKPLLINVNAHRPAY